ncbi:hypothetical protein [Mesorhizobium sp. L-8-10]|uniref:hypothetical protein n=1 Tax=Mesorhizobium sp. L-8-10 TaxID=2744523 RepID=UPI001FD15C46|nr:hypothetical protein [Mesorhizobium sp. L-8-10]
MSGLRCHGHEPFELAEAFLGQQAVLFEVEQAGGRFPQFGRAIRPCTKMQATFSIVAKIKFGECGLVAPGKGGLRTALLLQPADCEFDVLASAQLAGGVVRARTEIPSRPSASDRHPIAGFRDRIADPEFRKERFAPKIFKTERLLAAELPAQAALPVQRRKTCGRIRAREFGFLVRLGREASALRFH